MYTGDMAKVIMAKATADGQLVELFKIISTLEVEQEPSF